MGDLKIQWKHTKPDQNNQSDNTLFDLELVF